MGDLQDFVDPAPGVAETLPDDAARATLVGRAWLPAPGRPR